MKVETLPVLTFLFAFLESGEYNDIVLILSRTQAFIFIPLSGNLCTINHPLNSSTDTHVQTNLSHMQENCRLYLGTDTPSQTLNSISPLINNHIINE